MIIVSQNRTLILNSPKYIGYDDGMILALGVGSTDLIELGSYEIETTPLVFEKLKGKKILVKGNHDRKSCEAFLKYFDFACDTFTWHYNGIEIIFSHEPLKNFSQDLNIHGHLHNRPLKSKKHLLISLELMGYGVHSLPALVRKWKEKA